MYTTILRGTDPQRSCMKLFLHIVMAGTTQLTEHGAGYHRLGHGKYKERKGEQCPPWAAISVDRSQGVVTFLKREHKSA